MEAGEQMSITIEAGTTMTGSGGELRRVHRALVVGDAVALVVAVAAVVGVAAALGTADLGLAPAGLGAALIGLFTIRAQGLWDGHRSSVRSMELAGLIRAAAATGAGALLVDRLFGLSVPLAAAVGIALAGLVLLVVWRSALRTWLAANRSQGRFVQRTLIVGTDRRAAELVRLAEIHPEAGTRIVGVVGSSTAGRRRRHRRPLARRRRRPARRPRHRRRRPHRRQLGRHRLGRAGHPPRP